MAPIGGQAETATFTVERVSANAVTRAREVLAHMGISGIAEDAGTAAGRGGRIDYRYDRDAATVTCDVVEVPEALRDLPDHSAARAVREIMQGALCPEVGAEGGTDRPGEAGVYCYVIPTLKNDTNLDLSYSESEFSHGSLSSYTGTVAAGATTSLFEAHSSNASALGVSGSVTYRLTDGTPLKFTFNLLSTCDHSFAAGFKSQTGGSYKVPDVSNKDPKLHGYTYLEPMVAIGNK